MAAREGAAVTFHELANQKEKELHQLREKQKQAIEITLKSCQEELAEEQRKRKILEDDFKYNLSLIEQRDQDLLKYEAVFEELKKSINTRMGEMSDLRVQTADLRSKLDNAEKEKGELKKYYMQRLEQQQTHLDQYCKSKDNEATQLRTEYEQLQKQLQQRLVQVEEDLAMEKQRMISERDDSQRALQQEHRVKLDELTAQVLAKDSQLRQLQRELASAHNGAEQKHKDASDMGERVREMETKLREMEWNHTDETNTLQARQLQTKLEENRLFSKFLDGRLPDRIRVTELEGQLSHAETTIKTLRTESDSRRIELERMLKEKETMLQTVKESHMVKQTELERELGGVRALLEQTEIEGRRKEWNHNDNIKEKQLQIEKLQEELVRLREEIERKTAQHCQEMVQVDLQKEALQTTCDKLKAELTARIQDIEKYKHDLHLSNERERSVERSKVQLELDWQSRLEDMERSQYGRQEELIRTLTTARDQSLIQCREVEGKLMERVRACESLRQERDIALDALQRKGLTEPAMEILKGRGTTEAIEAIHKQNHELREVIGHMRNEMEKMAGGEQQEGIEQEVGGVNDQRYKTNKGYVLYLESEVERLTDENKEMKSAKKPPLPSNTCPSKQHTKKTNQPSVPPAMKIMLDKLQMEKASQDLDMAELRSHVRELESTIKSQQHQAYIQKALQVPKDKMQQKLLQATKVIIGLVEERDAMKEREMELKKKILVLEQCLKQLQETSCITADEDHGGQAEPTNNRKQGEETEQNMKRQEVAPWQKHKPPSSVGITRPSPIFNTGPSPLVNNTGPPPPPPVNNARPPPPINITRPPPPINITEPLGEVTTGGKLSLSPLRFSDSSYSSGLQALNNAMNIMEDDDMDGILKESPPISSRDKENRKTPPLTVKGSRVGGTRTTSKRGVAYKHPPLLAKHQQQKPKIRNYNNKD